MKKRVKIILFIRVIFVALLKDKEGIRLAEKVLLVQSFTTKCKVDVILKKVDVNSVIVWTQSLCNVIIFISMYLFIKISVYFL